MIFDDVTAVQLAGHTVETCDGKKRILTRIESIGKHSVTYKTSDDWVLAFAVTSCRSGIAHDWAIKRLAEEVPCSNCRPYDPSETTVRIIHKKAYKLIVCNNCERIIGRVNHAKT